MGILALEELATQAKAAIEANAQSPGNGVRTVSTKEAGQTIVAGSEPGAVCMRQRRPGDDSKEKGDSSGGDSHGRAHSRAARAVERIPRFVAGRTI